MHQPTGQATASVIGPEHTGVRRPMRVGVLGCGRVAETCHLPALRSLGRRVEVAALADTDEHRRRRVAGMFGVAHSFPDLPSMLAAHPAASIDIVVVCTPAPAHADAVIHSLQAGKHVLVEKPLALTLDDADRMADHLRTSAGHPKVMLGFNLRHHRLVLKARQLIAEGAIGEVQLIRTAWTCGIRGRMQLPPWRNRRESGGGVFSEIAVHHIDLLRYLTGAEIEQVFAQSTHGEGDDEAAILMLRLKGNATASCIFSERTADSNELELFGSKGRLAFSLYRFDSLTITRPGNYGGRAGRTIQVLKDLPEAWPILRRGGDFRETYRRQWLAFLDAIEHDKPVAATIDDGREALRVVLAAGASANAGRPLAVADAPRQPEPPRWRAAATEQVARSGESGPQLSAILATRSDFDAIRRTVRHLRAQTARDQIELLIICPNQQDLRLSEEELRGFWGHRVIEIGPFDSVAPANAAGGGAAAAPVVVLCEDHAFPDPDWAHSLIVAHRGPYAAVGPVIHNANPSTAVSRADFLIGYGAWAEPIKPCEPEHLPGHNSAYKRELLLAYGDRLAEMMEAESVLQWDMRRNGHRLYLDPSARLAHTNFARLGIWSNVQLHAGRVFAGTRAMSWPIWKRFLYAGASPLIPLVRLKRILGYSRRIGGQHAMRPRVLLTLMWGLTLDGVGQFFGYSIGAGSSKRIAHEFCRVRHITDHDRQQFDADDAAAAGAAAPAQLTNSAT